VGDLGKRLLSAVVFGPLIVLLFIFLPAKAFLVFIGIVVVMAAYEFTSMAQAANTVLIVLLTGAALVPLYFDVALYPLWLLCSAALYLLSRMTVRTGDMVALNKEIGRSLAALLLSEAFLAPPLFFLYGLKEIDRLLPLVLLLTIWASDTGAYLLGKAIGRHRLAPLISPKKTYEGLLGAVAGAMVVVLIFKGRLGLTPTAGIVLGCLLGLLGQLGDILESIAKRACEVKDSSRLIPGHGGLLDRVDSFLLTAPFIYYYFSGIRG
jgi:phosphatidate cytidylyltransferase